MGQAHTDPKQIFLEAIEDYRPDQWSAFLDRACDGDQQLRQRVNQLLEAHTGEESLMNAPAMTAGETIDEPVTEKLGSKIGPFKLLQKIGEGGMGVVYVAEQKKPVRRRVALKIIKPGMDTRAVIARFEVERQALAMMDHPNIAKVLDAGSTGSGRPYFVMELVNGVSVTEYCDEHRLSFRQRLELFVPICLAVQHAHQKGIIHRDLKPSNILVALYDGHPVSKIIDFGVAKATIQSLTEKTVFTQLGQIVGTLEYMSPEQAQRNQLDIDTRTDIYSLGVVLYELLTGETPFDRKRLRSAALDELLQIIREEEPMKPSTKIQSNAELRSATSKRRTEPRKLSALVRGELDWIVMKALEKERGRRYDTAGRFAEDVQHYLNNEPVMACPPSAAYRFRKFARRNKILMTTSAIVAASVVIGLFATSWQALRATRAELAAKQQEMAARDERNTAIAAEQRAQSESANTRDALRFLGEVLEQAAPYREPDRDLKVSALLERATSRLNNNDKMAPAVEAYIRQTLGRIYWGLGEFAQAENQLSRAYAMHQQQLGEGHPSTLNTAYDLATLWWMQSDFDRAEPMFEQVIAGLRNTAGSDHPTTLRAINGLGLIYVFREEAARAEALFANVLHDDQAIDGATAQNTTKLQIMRGLALTYIQQERFSEADALLSRVLQGQLNAFGQQHPETLVTKAMLAALYIQMDRLDEAQPLAIETLQMRQKVLGEFNAHTLTSAGALARVYLAQGRPADANILLENLLQQCRIQRNRLPPFTIQEIGDVGVALLAEQRFADAESFLRLYVDVAGEKTPDGWRKSWMQSAFGASLLGQQKLDEAEPWLVRGYENLRRFEQLIPEHSRKKRMDDASARLNQLKIARGDSAKSGDDPR